MSNEDLNALSGAYHDTFKFTDENVMMLSWYSKRVLEALQRGAARRLISLGVGHQVVAETLIGGGSELLDSYTIVEGSETIIQEFRERMGGLPDWVHLEHAWFEQFEIDEPADAIEMGFVLEHVDDPELVLNRFAKMLRPGGSMLIAVPNARSLHRMIGHEAGLLDNVYRLSEYDLQYGHKRYFDLESFTRLVLSCGLLIRAVEGLYLKPVTTAQLEQLQLPPEIYTGLCRVGQHHPDLCNSIYIEATL